MVTSVDFTPISIRERPVIPGGPASAGRSPKTAAWPQDHTSNYEANRRAVHVPEVCYFENSGGFRELIRSKLLFLKTVVFFESPAHQCSLSMADFR
jgi:hypothetical protein